MSPSSIDWEKSVPARFSHDLHRAWAKLRGQADPFAKVGQVNDREKKTSPSGGESKYVWALKDIDFGVEKGEILGIIGRNGAGKSTLLKLLSRVTAPTTGRIKARGRIASLLEVGTGFHPELTGRENIYLNGAVLGMRRHEITRQLDAIVEFSGCAKYIDTPTKRYSSGMTVRLGFAVAAHLDCEILVVDEVLAVGDAEFQKKCIGKMHEVSQDSGKTVLFVSHNLGSVSELCSRGTVLVHGTVQYTGPIQAAIRRYMENESSSRKSSCSFERDPNRCFSFVEACIENDRGVSEQVALNDPVNVVFSYVLESEMRGLELAIAVSNSRSIRVFTSERSCVFKTPVQPGSHRVKVTIPKAVLVPDTYSVHLSASIPNSRLVHSIPDAISFEVIDDGYHFSRYSGSDIGNVLVNCDWKEQ